MAVGTKGKQIAEKSPASRSNRQPPSSSPVGEKRKQLAVIDDEESKPSSSRRKKRLSVALQFFDDVAAEVDDDDDGFSDLDLNYLQHAQSSKDVPEKLNPLLVFPKEEELSGDELERLIADRYGHVNGEDVKKYNDGFPEMQGTKDPFIWKVKCKVGLERKLCFSLMQKYAHLKEFGTKLQVFSVFAADHVQGYIFVEAEKSSDVSEVCKGFCNLYSTKAALVSRNEVPHLFSARSKPCGVSVGSWVRMKGGNYKGDIAQVISVDPLRGRATVKVVPRIDIQALARKLGGGESLKQAEVPVPRLISSRDIQDFRPYIESKRDRETGEVYDVLDGLMLRDGFLFKRVSFGSLIFWDVKPSEAERQMFMESNKDGAWDSDWVSSVYGGRNPSKLGESSRDREEAMEGKAFNIHDLVLFGKNAFGVIVAEDSDSFQILKGDKKAPEVVVVNLCQIKKACIDKMFVSSDLHKKKICVGDVVRVMEGPRQGRKGIVRHMYKGILFLYDENQTEDSGIFCVQSGSCVNATGSNDSLGKKSVKHTSSSFVEPSSSGFEEDDNNRSFDRSRQSNKHSIYSIGQTLRINKGPLKGYLCRVMRIFRSEITVKLDSLSKILTVGEQLLSVPNLRRDEPAAVTSGTFGNEGWGSFGVLSGEVKEALTDGSSWDINLQSTGRNSWAGATDGKQDQNEGDDPWGDKIVASGSREPQTNQALDCWGADKSSANAAWNNTKDSQKTTVQDSGQNKNWVKASDCWNSVPSKADTDGWDNGSSRTGMVSHNETQNANWPTVSDDWNSTSTRTDDNAWGGWESGNVKNENARGGSDATMGDINTDVTWDTDKDKAHDCSTSEKWERTAAFKEGNGGWNSPLSKSGERLEGGWESSKTSKSNQESEWHKGDTSGVGSSDNWSKPSNCGVGETSGWNKAEVREGDEHGSWSKAKDSGDGEVGGWTKRGFSNNALTDGWDKQNWADHKNESGNWSNAKPSNDTKNDSWCKEPASGCDGTVSSWNGSGYEEKGNQGDNWNRPRSYEGSQGFGRGRGRGRGDGGLGFDWDKWRNDDNKDGGNRHQGNDWSGQNSRDGDSGSSGGRGRGTGRFDNQDGDWERKRDEDGGWRHGRERNCAGRTFHSGRCPRNDSSDGSNNRNNFGGDSSSSHGWNADQSLTSDRPSSFDKHEVAKEGDNPWGGSGRVNSTKWNSSSDLKSGSSDHVSAWGKGNDVFDSLSQDIAQSSGQPSGWSNGDKGNDWTSWKTNAEKGKELMGKEAVKQSDTVGSWGNAHNGKRDAEQEVVGKSWNTSTPRCNSWSKSNDNSVENDKSGAQGVWNKNDEGWDKPKFTGCGQAATWNDRLFEGDEGGQRGGHRRGWNGGRSFDDQSSDDKGNAFTNRGCGQGRGFGGRGGRSRRDSGRDQHKHDCFDQREASVWGAGWKQNEFSSESKSKMGQDRWDGDNSFRNQLSGSGEGGWSVGESAGRNTLGGWDKQDSEEQNNTADSAGGSSGWGNSSESGWLAGSNHGKCSEEKTSAWNQENAANEWRAGNEDVGNAWERGAGSSSDGNKGGWN